MKANMTNLTILFFSNEVCAYGSKNHLLIGTIGWYFTFAQKRALHDLNIILILLTYSESVKYLCGQHLYFENRKMKVLLYFIV